MPGLSIKGFLPTSLLDWPGRICSVLFLQGCNFRCPYCHNPSLVGEAEGESGLDWKDVASYLESKKGWVDGVVITGGEPTIQSWLPSLITETVSMGFPVKLDTNGSRPDVLKKLVGEGGVEFFSMDVKTSLGKYPLVTRTRVSVESILRSIDIIKGSNIGHEFRCTVVPGLVDFTDLRQIAQRLIGADLFTLQQFRPEDTLEPALTGLKPYPDDILHGWADRLSAIVPVKVKGTRTAVDLDQKVAS